LPKGDFSSTFILIMENKYLNFLKSIFSLLLLIFIISITIFFSDKKTPKYSENSNNIILNQSYKDFHLLIPDINVSAPIIADVDGNKKDTYLKALEGGVAHFKDSAKPGEGSNIFIFGHSSFYPWAPGDYKYIFVNLNQLEKDNIISVWWQEKEHKYKITQKKIVKPEQTEVLNPTEKEQLTLMTCYPPGTTLKRLIIIAEPI
jgi:LPXTG-site transpeptidase (sortase) family protein